MKKIGNFATNDDFSRSRKNLLLKGYDFGASCAPKVELCIHETPYMYRGVIAPVLSNQTANRIDYRTRIGISVKNHDPP